MALDSSCAFYTQSEYTMRPVVLFGRYLTYRNKSESMSTGNFVFELLKNLTGKLDYNTLSLPYKKGFKKQHHTDHPDGAQHAGRPPLDGQSTGNEGRLLLIARGEQSQASAEAIASSGSPRSRSSG
jgi:hypothetical protein